VTYSHNLLLL